jgi:hypothetical protein
VWQIVLYQPLPDVARISENCNSLLSFEMSLLGNYRFFLPLYKQSIQRQFLEKATLNTEDCVWRIICSLAIVEHPEYVYGGLDMDHHSFM